MSQKIDKLLNQADAYDVYPTVKLRPLLTPPRTENDPADPELWAMWCPNHLRVCVVEDSITKFPALIRCNGRPVVVELGRAIFVGPHLLVPSKRERLLIVLMGMYGDDVLMGSARQWVQNPGIKSDWPPIDEATMQEFREMGALGRGKPVAVSE